MKKFAFKKLVRDNIAARIESNGGVVSKRILSKDEYTSELLVKLAEESNEVAAASEQELAGELADVYEVLEAICNVKGISQDQIQAERNTKNDKNGAFDARIYIDHVEVAADNKWVAYYEENSDRYPEITQ